MSAHTLRLARRLRRPSLLGHRREAPVNQIENAVEVFGLVPVAVMGLTLAMMAALAFSMSILAED